MKSLRYLIASAGLALGTLIATPVFAAGSYVFDGAGLLQPATVTDLNTRIDALHTQTGKEVVVDTVDSISGQSARDMAAAEFQKHDVNGVLIFIAKSPKTVGVIGDRASAVIFPAGTFSDIRSSIRSAFRDGHYDEGVTNGVNLLIDTYRSHAGALQQRVRPRYIPHQTSYAYQTEEHSGINWWLVIVIVLGIWLIIRAISRASGGYGGGPGYGAGPGYGQGPGYGPGPGYAPGGWGGGGGGGFFSSLLGGLGGAFLGNELFNSFNRPNEMGNQPTGFVDTGYDQGSVDQGSYDQGGFQNDAGQADMGNASFGDWGDGGGNGGDLGGGGGGDNSGW